MVERKAVIKNEQGIHCRPSSVIIREAMTMAGHITVTSHAGTCNLKSIMGLLSLGLSLDTEVLIRVEGGDEDADCDRLVELFEREYDFPPEA